MIMEINTLSVTNIVNINNAFIVNLTTNKPHFLQFRFDSLSKRRKTG